LPHAEREGCAANGTNQGGAQDGMVIKRSPKEPYKWLGYYSTVTDGQITVRREDQPEMVLFEVKEFEIKRHIAEVRSPSRLRKQRSGRKLSGQTKAFELHIWGKFSPTGQKQGSDLVAKMWVFGFEDEAALIAWTSVLKDHSIQPSSKKVMGLKSASKLLLIATKGFEAQKTDLADEIQAQQDAFSKMKLVAEQSHIDCQMETSPGGLWNKKAVLHVLDDAIVWSDQVNEHGHSEEKHYQSQHLDDTWVVSSCIDADEEHIIITVAPVVKETKQGLMRVFTVFAVSGQSKRELRRFRGQCLCIALSVAC